MAKNIMIKRKAKTSKKKKNSQKTSGQSVSALGAALRTLGGLGGSALGAMMGAPGAGGTIGNSLGGALSRWLGAGDYTVGSNTIVSKSLKAASSIPMMHNESQSVIIRHKEFLGEIRGSVGFSVQASYVLNPGNKVTFPWLSTIANSFQEYTIRGAVFHYVPSSGTAVSGTNPALGTVMIQTSYRSTDTVPSSKVEMLNEYCSNECSPAETFAHPIECDPKENPFNVQYVRAGTVPTGDSQLIYDLGVTNLAVSGMPATGNVVGDLWLTYEVELRKPLLASNVTSNGQVMFAQCAPTSSSNIFGSPTYNAASNWGITVSGNTIFFPAGSVGNWEIVINLAPTTTFTALSGWLPATGINCTVTNWHPYLSAQPASVTTIGGTAPTITQGFVLSGVSIADPSALASWTLPAFTVTGSFSGCYVSVSRLY